MAPVAPPAAAQAKRVLTHGPPSCVAPCVGPVAGTVLLAGGGRLGHDILQRFVALAGGRDARIVVIPTAGVLTRHHPSWIDVRLLRDAGARNVQVLHTRSRYRADTEDFTAPLRSADAVWISGGRQWRLVEAYLGTRTETEIHMVLARGGVVGGSSAGASIMASYLVRGGTEGNQVVMAPGYEQGFGLLRRTAVDQHLTARGRETDLLAVLNRHPELLGIGLDEGTAVVVRRDRAEVVGRKAVTFYDGLSRDRLITRLRAGDVYDLGLRARRGSATDGDPASTRPGGGG